MVSPEELAEGTVSSPIQVCILCSKPFNDQLSYQRHLTYCRRNQDRPRKRGKSCQACSRAKTKCSFHPRCLRCVSKALECIYDRRNASSNLPGPSPRSINSQDVFMLDFGDNAPQDLSDTPQFDQNPISAHVQGPISSNNPGVSMSSLYSQNLLMLNFEENSLLKLSDTPHFPRDLSSMHSQDLSMLNFKDNTFLDFSDSQCFRPNPAFNNSQDFSMPSLEDYAFANNSDFSHFNKRTDGMSIEEDNELMAFTNLSQSPTLNLLYGSSPDCPTVENFATSHVDSINRAGTLAHLRIPDPVAQQSATLLMRALRTIPERMLRRDTFPPFIHSQNHRKALPEPLAICMGIAQIFATRTPDIGSFIWRTIQTEQMRVLTEHQKFSRQDLLAAIQAHMVYIVMRIIDGSEGSIAWNREMLVICGILCRSLINMCNEPFCQDELSHPSLTWEDWIFAESRRRTACAWFLLSCIVSVNNGLSCDALEDVGRLPLPSSKKQWEASSHTVWENELEIDGNTLWTFGGLLDAHNTWNEPSSAQLLDSWNAKIDDLGNLMNIATGIMCRRN